MAERVLITGCSGFIASWVTKYALDAGYIVRGTVRDPTNQKKTKFLRELPGAAERLELVALDLEKSDQEVFDRVAQDCTFILHTASPIPLTQPKDEDELIKPAVNGTLMVLRAALKSPTVKRVAVTSSGVAISNPKAKPGTTFGETDWADPSDPNLVPYPKSKILAERAAWDFVKENKPLWAMCTINPTFVLGPSISTERTASAEIGVRLLNGAMPMVAHVSFPIVDVRNVAMAHIKALQISSEAMNGRRFIIYNKTLWFTQVATMINDSFGPMGYKAPTREAPYLFLWGMSFFDSGMAFLLPRLNKFVLYDTTPSREVLGIEYKPIEETIRDYCHSLIYFGHAQKLPGYAPPSLSWTPVNS